MLVYHAAQNASKRALVGNLNQNLTDAAVFSNFGGHEEFAKVMFAEFGQNNAWMNIDGRDVQLKLVKESRGEQERVGGKWTRTLALRDISVTSNYVATRVCAPNDETCESTDYDATFVVRKGRSTQTVRAFGWCGC